MPLPIDMPSEPEAFGLFGAYITPPEGSYHWHEINKGFADVFDLSVSIGRSFNDADFNTRFVEGVRIPTLLGSDFAKYYKPGDIINERYEVVGILDRRAFYLAPGESASINYLKTTIPTPPVIDVSTLYDMLGEGTYFVDSPDMIAQIDAKAHKLDLFDELEFVSYSDQLQNIVKELLQYVYMLSNSRAHIAVLHSVQHHFHAELHRRTYT